MARSELQDPLDKFRWKVSIGEFTRAGFTACTTPSFSMSTYNYPEGGAHLNPRQIMDKITYAPVVLTRGVTPDQSFNRWATGHFDVVQNSDGLNISTPLEDTFGFEAPAFIQQTGAVGPAPQPSFGQGGKEYRKDVSIKHVNKSGQTIVEYNLYGAWVIAYKPASDFDAMDDEGFSVETITLAYDGFDVRYGGLAGALVSGAINGIV